MCTGSLPAREAFPPCLDENEELVGSGTFSPGMVALGKSFATEIAVKSGAWMGPQSKHFDRLKNLPVGLLHRLFFVYLL